MDASPAIISLIDTESWQVCFQNGSGRSALGELVGKSCFQNIPKLPDLCPFCRATEALQTGKTTMSEVPLPDGRWLLVQWAPVRSGQTLLAVETITDITDSKTREEEYRRLKEQFEQLAAIDPLTALLNRRGWNDLALRLCQRAAQDREPVGVLIADLDHFKSINDRWGHAAGDGVLRHVAALLKRHCRPNDLVGRWGGEEFVVMMQGSADDMRAAAERLRQQSASTPCPGQAGSEPISFTLSIGANSFTPVSGDLEELEAALARADELLYQAKQAGRNRVCMT
jgi:diguanylate cyclase (GGDEF)-like protein